MCCGENRQGIDIGLDHIGDELWNLHQVNEENWVEENWVGDNSDDWIAVNAEEDTWESESIIYCWQIPLNTLHLTVF